MPPGPAWVSVAADEDAAQTAAPPPATITAATAPAAIFLPGDHACFGAGAGVAPHVGSGVDGVLMSRSSLFG
ncbi:hypothetical protein GCM10017567_15390 [Amycolatopsis bullii]|uniref:Uncharacterized protein n=1 Tax=Amycolatopsis bullii TaxID=941987 RepID=A0ABQ3K2I9_9PSEU|nr:hypothetical protein GCM10017567_15390 [Amycolatopsis bullii]